MSSPRIINRLGSPALDWLHAVPDGSGFGIIRQDDDKPRVAMTKLRLTGACSEYLDGMDYERDYRANPCILHMATGYSQLNLQLSEGWHRDHTKSVEARAEFEYTATRFFPESDQRQPFVQELSLGFAKAAAALNQRYMVIEFKAYGATYEAPPYDLHEDEEDFFTIAAYPKGYASIMLAPPGVDQLRALTRSEMPVEFEPDETKVYRYKLLSERCMAAWPTKQLHEGPMQMLKDKTRVAVFGFANRLTPEPAL